MTNMSPLKIPEELMGTPLWLWIILAVVWVAIFILIVRSIGRRRAKPKTSAGHADYRSLEVKDYISGQPVPQKPEKEAKRPKKEPARKLPSKPLPAATDTRMSTVRICFLVLALIMATSLILYRNHHARMHEEELTRQAAAQRAAQEVSRQKPVKTIKKPLLFDAEKLAKQGAEAFKGRDYGLAEELFRESLSLVQKSGTEGAFAQVEAFNNLAFTLVKQDRFDEAEVFFYRALDSAEESGTADTVGVAHAKAGLARMHIRQGRFEEVTDLFDEAIAILDKRLGQGNETSAEVLLEKTGFLASLGHSQEIKPIQTTIVEPTPASGISAAATSGEVDSGPRSINLSVTANFRPILHSAKGPNGRWIPNSIPLSPDRPKDIIKEPEYEGEERRYGHISMGNPAYQYFFSLDRSASSSPVMYFDANKNGDLTDDGAPHSNIGKGFFAASLSIPVSLVLHRYGGLEDFAVWFYLREQDWDGKASHHSQTQMKGFVELDDSIILAFLGEKNINDGDFTNDGIYLDIDKNGKIDSDNEFVDNGETVEFAGQEYRFTIIP